MKTLRECIADAQAKKVAIGHFNISNIEGFWAVVRAAKNLNVPAIIGVWKASELSSAFLKSKRSSIRLRPTKTFRRFSSTPTTRIRTRNASRLSTLVLTLSFSTARNFHLKTTLPRRKKLSRMPDRKIQKC